MFKSVQVPFANHTNYEAGDIILCTSRTQNSNLQHGSEYEVTAYIIFSNLEKCFASTLKSFPGRSFKIFWPMTFQINGDAAIYVSSTPEGDHLVRDDSTFRIWLEAEDISHQPL